MTKLQLEIKTYSRKEFAEIMGISEKDKNFKRKAEKFLQNCGYAYNANMRKGVELIEAPSTAEGKLSDLLYRYLDMDIRIDSYAFGLFLYNMLNDVDGFAEAPWRERVAMLKDWYDLEISERTLKSWCSLLAKKGVLVKSETEVTYWMTKDDKTQIEISKDDPDRLAYWKEFWERTKRGESNISKTLWHKYGACFYSVKKFDCAAWDENYRDLFETIYKLVEEITDKADSETEIKVINRVEFIEVPKVKEEITPQIYLQDVKKPPKNLVRINKKNEEFKF